MKTEITKKSGKLVVSIDVEIIMNQEDGVLTARIIDEKGEWVKKSMDIVVMKTNLEFRVDDPTENIIESNSKNIKDMEASLSLEKEKLKNDIMRLRGIEYVSTTELPEEGSQPSC